MSKKVVLCKNSSKLAASRKVKAFFGSMGDIYRGPRNFRNCKGVQDTFVFKQYFLVREKRWGKPACGELKIPNPVHSMSAFQNGRFVLPPQITTGGR